MLRKIVFFTVLFAVLAVSAVQPGAAQSLDQGDTITLRRPASSLRELPRNYGEYDLQVQARDLRTTDDVRRLIPIGDSFTTPPPPPQKYHVWYFLPDLGIALDCVYDDETGELQYCDIYA